MKEGKFLKGDLSNLFFSFEGRIGRGQWWLANIFLTIATLPLSITLFLLDTPSLSIYSILVDSTPTTMIITLLFMVVYILPAYLLLVMSSASIFVKRYHDRGKSGYWYFIYFIPYIGFIWAIIELGFFKGDSGENEYGHPQV